MLTPFKSEKTQHPLLRLLSDSPTLESILWSVAAAVVVAPLVEELLFRVVLQGWLKTVIAPRWAIGITSVLFGFVHGFPDAIPLVVLAIVLGYVYQQRNSYAAVVTMHGLFNAFNLTLLLLGGPPPTS